MTVFGNILPLIHSRKCKDQKTPINYLVETYLTCSLRTLKNASLALLDIDIKLNQRNALCSVLLNMTMDDVAQSLCSKFYIATFSNWTKFKILKKGFV